MLSNKTTTKTPLVQYIEGGADAAETCDVHYGVAADKGPEASDR